MGGMESEDPELDAALRELAGGNLYRNNIFRVTGLPIDASPTQIRRRREEIALDIKLGKPLSSADGELPRDPAPDADAIKVAFESLRSPTARLTHELLWLWKDNDIGEHDAAIRAHCAAAEAEYAMDPLEPDHPDAARLDLLWKQALSSWWELLASDELWDWARRRVHEINDARLTTGTVRRLRSRLPAHIVAVSAELAVRAAEVGSEAADRHVELLDNSMFDDEMVDRVLREAVRPAEERLRTACEAATNFASPRAAGRAGAELLDQARPLLRVAAGVLGADDPVAEALHDQVAAAVNICAVAYDEKFPDSAEALHLWVASRELARELVTIDRIDRNLELFHKDRIMRPVDPLRQKGYVERAAAILRAQRRRTRDEGEREQLSLLLADDYSMVAPLTGPPARGSWFGFGVYLYGRRARRPDGRYIATHFLTALFIPVLPLAAYICDGIYIYGKVRLSPFTLWWRRVMTVVLVFLAMSLAPGAIALWTTAAFTALGLGSMAIRELRVSSTMSRQATG